MFVSLVCDNVRKHRLKVWVKSELETFNEKWILKGKRTTEA